MTFHMIFVLIVIIAMFVALVLEIARPDLIVFSALVVFLLTGILTPEEALSGFSNQGMLTIALLFIVAGAVQKHGLIEEMMTKWLDKSKSVKSSMIRFFMPTSISSAFLNNTPIVVTFTPMIKKWCEDRGIAPSKFLLPLSYVTILGGTITLMGTSTNLVIHGMLLDRELEGFHLFQLAVVGFPITIIGFIYLFTVGLKMLPNHLGFTEKVQADSREYIAEMTVQSDFPYVDQSVQKAGLRELTGLYLVEIIRQEERVSPVRSTTVIQEGDRLIFTGLISTIADLQNMKGLTLETGSHLALEDLKNGDTQLVEAVVSHQSSLLSKSIKESQFRSRFDAGVLAVHRDNERIQSKVGDIVLRPGDILLLLTGTDFIRKYQQSSDFYVVSSLDAPSNLKDNRRKGWFALGTLISLITLVTAGVFSMFKAMLLAVFIFLLTKVIRVDEAKNYLQFHVLLLIASAIGVGAAMTKTGLARWIAEQLLAVVEPLGMLAILVIVYLLTNIFTELITNSAAAVLMLPIGLEIATGLDVHYMGIAVIIAIAASASFITPIGYQTNLIVYGPGGYKFRDYIKVGTPLSILVMFVTVTVVHMVWF
ncbi:sulfur deprivation response regulator [Gracilibacillus halophilus YIM-C55.5]|uniref:Sulfur deprivation response regulator n=1 Tax=Gracilibacillus halophilus YIM-C55.5 TaxID=1308866 RepID=N4WSR5_9BACI|nr:SLC13 family permease [Gracilibacillus halophilus]ENH96211.1 sulfur deprivation response regulator [Gracilibacillus halophilus YIM-C55.5]